MVLVDLKKKIALIVVVVVVLLVSKGHFLAFFKRKLHVMSVVAQELYMKRLVVSVMAKETFARRKI